MDSLRGDPVTLSVRHLEAGGVLVTPGLRQARIYRRLHDRAQVAAGRRVWPAASILPLDAWLAECWRELSLAREELPEPLPAPALDWLWRSQVAGDADGLLDPASLARRARRAWLALRAHGGSPDDLARYPRTRDQQAFLAWSQSVERELAARGACDGADLARLAVQCDALPSDGPPIFLAGFRGMMPAARALFDALHRAGRTVTRLVPEGARHAVHRHPAADVQAEQDAMLDWLRHRLEARPEGLHAIVVPGLDARRGALERALAARLQPDAELPGGAREELLFDAAGGPPLALQPVAAAALDAIAAALGRLDWPLLSRLLRSPHLAAAAGEGEARARLDVALRERPGTSLPAIAPLVARANAAEAAQFARCLTEAAAAVAGPSLRTPSDWAERFGACLAAWGWPGARPDSREFQAARRFSECLRGLASLSGVSSRLSAGEALAELRELTAGPFQAESGEPAVLLLDELDDPGVPLDSLWVSGLTAAAWPRPVDVEPLLPIEVQRVLGMPRITAEACVVEAREVEAAWRAAARELVLSWPRRESDADVQGSPLVPKALPALAAPLAAPTRERLAFAASALEPVPERELPRLAGPVHGGAQVVELQAQCPFRAFARLRLRADRLEEPQSGVDRRQRGESLHRALQDLWRDLGTQSALLALVPAEREARVRAAVARTLAAVLPAGAGERTRALEGEWQRRAIEALLALDAARPAFEVVETERAFAGRIAGLELALRVDRVDRVGEDLVVIDYKTGRMKKALWRGARMEAPQLPLYAALHPGRPGAIAIAQVTAAGAEYRGVGRDAAILPGLDAAEEFELTEEGEAGFEWPRLRQFWYAWLERLAEDHARGRADVDPKLGAETCRSCHLAALCRVSSALAEEDEGAGGDE